MSKNDMFHSRLHPSCTADSQRPAAGGMRESMGQSSTCRIFGMKKGRSRSRASYFAKWWSCCLITLWTSTFSLTAASMESVSPMGEPSRTASLGKVRLKFLNGELGWVSSAERPITAVLDISIQDQKGVGQ